MTLDSGLYIITNGKAQGHDATSIGRYPIEDLSLRPKRILALPPNQGFQPPRWVVEKRDKGYRLKALGAPTGVYDGKVYAFLLNEPDIQEWIVTPQPQHGENIYTVEKNDRSAGWVVGESEDSNEPKPILVKPLISTKSLPPQFPENELFTFIRIDRD